MSNFTEWLREAEKGLYVGVKYTQSAEDDIKIFCEENNIPNPIPRDEIHTTLIYSTKYANVILNDKGEDIGSAKPLELEVFNTQDNKRCLVIKLESEYLTNRHKELMKNYPSLTYDYPEYIPHITLSYDIGDFDISEIKLNESTTLPMFFNIITEYKEDLQVNKYS